jgi:PD-(D/E)XK nuclease superfamily
MKKTIEQNEYISYSGLKDWVICPHKYKLIRIDNLRFAGNIHTAFGKACHTSIEESLYTTKKMEIIKEESSFDVYDRFQKHFKTNIESLPHHIKTTIDNESIEVFSKQAQQILTEVLEKLEETFPNYKIDSVEYKLNIPFKEYKINDYNFLGYIDLILRTPDGKYHIIDWKTCSWGWEQRKKNDKMVIYQLTLYKEFLSRMRDIKPEDIETHFALLKRTAKEGKKVEIFRVSNGNKRINNAIKLLYKAVYNIEHKNFIKKKLSDCQRCEFYKTEHCK